MGGGLLLLLLLSLVSRANAFLEDSNSGIQFEFTTSVQSIETDTVPLTITCKCSISDNPHLDTVVSLKLSKKPIDGATPEVNLVTVTSANTYTTVAFSGIWENSYISENGSDAFLEAEYPFPTDTERGVYMCEVVGEDMSGSNVVGQSHLTVGPLDPGFEDLSKCMDEKVRPTSLVEMKESLIQCGASPGDWFQMLRDLTELSLSQNSTIHGVSRIFDSNSFYIFTTENLQFTDGVKICEDHYGYLAELNTEREFMFIKESFNFLRETKEHQLDFLATGASYKTLDSEFEFFTHPGAPMYLGHWEEGEPDRSDLHHNWLLIKVKQGFFEMIDGVKQNWDLSFLCEISKESI